MTDKQIKIDVCPYQGECSVSGCKRNDDGCFVRQLFEERDRAEKRIIELNKTIKTKEQEYEESKKCIKHLQVDVTGCKYSTFGGGCTMLKTCGNNPNCYYKQLKRKEQECKNLKQTLTEIKEIAKIKQKQSVFVGETVFEQILQKISEAISE